MFKRHVFLVFLGFPALVHAGNSLQIAVTGYIMPAACQLETQQMNVLDYGTIVSRNLQYETSRFGGEVTKLPEKQINFSIVCSSNTNIQLKAVSHRLGTTSNSLESGSGFAPAPIKLLDTINGSNLAVAGLGRTAENTAIGGFALAYDPASLRVVVATGDQAQGQTYSGKKISLVTNDGDMWRPQSGYSVFSQNADVGTSFSINREQPVAAILYSGVLKVQAYLNKQAVLESNQQHVMLDGLATIEINYL